MGMSLMGVSGAGFGQGYAYVNVGITSGLPIINGIQIGIPFVATDSKGRALTFMGVLYNPTSPPSVVVGPVYWKDNTFTVVTSNIAEAVVASGPNLIAGILLNPNVTTGYYTVIQVGGYFGASSDALNQNGLLAAPSGGVTAGYVLVPSTTSQSMAVVAAGTAPTYIPIGIVLTTASASASFDVLMTMPPRGF